MSTLAMTVSTDMPTAPNVSCTTLWRAYSVSGDRRLRDRLVFTLAPLVGHAGGRADEAVARGLGALVSAIESYEPERDGALERFVWLRVHAALRAG